MIEMVSVEDSMRKYYRRDEDRFRLHFDLRQFKAQYASGDHADGNPFRNSTTLDEGSREWIQRSSLDEQKRDELLLCCPEDVERCTACSCKDDGGLCNRCRIPHIVETEYDAMVRAMCDGMRKVQNREAPTMHYHRPAGGYAEAS